MTDPDPAKLASQVHLTKLYEELALETQINASATALTPADEVAFASYDKWAEQRRQTNALLQNFLGNVSLFEGGDKGVQMPVPPGVSEEDVFEEDASGAAHVLFVGEGGFLTVSDAVNTSFVGQTVHIRAGSHHVGDTLTFLGLDDDEQQLVDQLKHRSETLVVGHTWSLSLQGDPFPHSPASMPPSITSTYPSSEVVGSWVMDDQSHGHIACLALTHDGQERCDCQLPRGDQRT